MCSFASSDGADRYPLNAVVAVAEVIPLGTLRLGISRLIGRTRTHVRRTRLVEASDKLPPAPAAALRLPTGTCWRSSRNRPGRCARDGIRALRKIRKAE